MEIKEAIEWLINIKEKYIHGGDEFYDHQRRTAIDYAVAALERIGEKPLTNADSIQSTEDELATTLHAVKMGYAPWCDHHCENEGDDGCDNCIKNWLQQPAKEG